MIAEALPVTVELNLYALFVSLVIAIPLGIAAAMRRNSPLDYATSVLLRWALPFRTSGLASC